MNKLRGFTLIELLIVIAILGVLAVIVLVLVNPVENQAKARDTGRISTVTQVGHALQAYYTSTSSYPDVSNWAQDLLDRGELSTFPSGIAYNAYGITACTTYVQPVTDPTYCYNIDATNGVIIFAKAEASTHRTKCATPGDEAYFVFSTADSRTGTICSAAEPTPWVSGTQTYVD